MTVSSQANRVSFTGNGATTSFSTTPVIFFDTDDLTVYVVTTATGASTTLTENTHYIVSGGSGAIGTVNLAGGSSPYGAPSSSQTLVIVRELDIVQEVDLLNNDESDAEVVEDEFDKLTMMIQQVDNRLDRAFVLADSDVTGVSTTLPTPAASELIGWNSGASALTNYAAASIVDTIVPTSHMETVLASADADETFQIIVTGATAETAPATGDLIMISDVSLTPDDGRKMTLANMLKVIASLTGESAPATGDSLALYDASTSTVRNITLSDLLTVVNVLTATTTINNEADYALVYDASESGAARVLTKYINPIIVGTEVAATSGTSIDFTGIPSGVKRITINFDEVSTNGTDSWLVQLGDAGGIEASGYVSRNLNAGPTQTQSTAGFIIAVGMAATATGSGSVTLTLQDSANFTWCCTSIMGHSDPTVSHQAGRKALSAELTQVRITTTGGANTFDAGGINITYEY